MRYTPTFMQKIRMEKKMEIKKVKIKEQKSDHERGQIFAAISVGLAFLTFLYLAPFIILVFSP